MTKLRTQLRDRKARRFFAEYLSAKMAGLAVVARFILGVGWYLETPLSAEHGAPAYHPEYAFMGSSPIPSGRSNRPPGGVPVPDGSAIGVGD